MIKVEAARILNVAANAKQQDIDSAYLSLRHKYLTQSQYSTDPGERGVANTSDTLRS